MVKCAETEHFKEQGKLKTPTDTATPKPSAKSRQSKRAPEPLAKIIRLVNLVPQERLPPLDLVPLHGNLPAPPQGDWPKDFAFRRWVVNSDRLTLRQWLDCRLEGLPKEFREYVTQDDGGPHFMWFFGALYRYDFVRESRRKLREIVRAVREAERTARLAMHLYLETHSKVFIDESWIIRKTDDEFDAAIFGDEKGIDARDIRRCEVCDRIFFARRVNSKVCDPNGKCEATLRKRNERANARRRAELKAKKGKRK
jgi:hypothetical protein